MYRAWDASKNATCERGEEAYKEVNWLTGWMDCTCTSSMMCPVSFLGYYVRLCTFSSIYYPRCPGICQSCGNSWLCRFCTAPLITACTVVQAIV